MITGGKTFELENGLYGSAFTVDTWGPIIIILGGAIFGLLEKEFRSWTHYDRKVLGIAFLGGIIFSYGTCLAESNLLS